MIAPALDYLPKYAIFSHEGEGAGDEAYAISRRIEKVREEISRSVYLSEDSEAAIAELWNLSREACVDNWDGENGKAVSQNSLFSTMQLLRSLPRTYPAPDIGLDYDGDVTLSWDSDPALRVTITVTSTGKLAYAWLHKSALTGTERNYGVAEANGVLPNTLALVLSRIA